MPPRIAFRGLGVALFLCLGAAATAQEQKGYTVTSERAAPRSDLSKAYDDATARYPLDRQAIYAEELTGDLSKGAAAPRQRRDRAGDEGIRLGGGGGGVLAVILALLIALLLWMKFGGAGILLSGEPREIRQKQKAPESWKIAGDEADLDAQTLLQRISAMADRRDALVRLLRHCLLFAGEDSDTRFARSDTEREAFRRLPEGWQHRPALATLLRDAELAHYGGRDVGDETFAHALELGRGMLMGQKRSRHA